MNASEFMGKGEIFWVAFSSLSTAATLVVVFLYTLYTRKMMKLAEENRRADITVVLSMRDFAVIDYLPQSTRPYEIGNVRFKVRNIGRGPAAHVSAWCNEVSSSFDLGDIEVFTRNQFSRHTPVPITDLTSGEVIEILFYRIDTTKDLLFVVDALDIALGRHQLLVLSKAHEQGYQVKAVHAMGDTFGERSVRFVRRYLEISKAIEKMLTKFEDYE